MNEQAFLLFDAHVHIYPCYNLRLALHAAWKNLEALIPQAPYPVAALGLALTERPDCHVFRSLADGDFKDGDFKDLGISCETPDDGQSLCLHHPEHKLPLHIFPGRQYVSKEGVEVLALGKDLDEMSKLSALALAEKILEAGLLPCLPWSPGKWLGKRGVLVQELLHTFHTQQMLLGDILMRPWIFPTPGLLYQALHNGYRVLGGSDSLPFPGEEKNIGRMATLAIGNFQARSAARDFLRLLHYQPMIRLPEDGGFLGIREFVYRMGRNEMVRRCL